MLIPLPNVKKGNVPGPELYKAAGNLQRDSDAMGLERVANMFKRGASRKELSANNSSPNRRRNASAGARQSLVAFTKVASLHSGAYFGEIALFNSESTRTATIQAIVNSTYFTLSRVDFEKICPSFPQVRIQWILCGREGGRVVWRVVWRGGGGGEVMGGHAGWGQQCGGWCAV